MEDIPETEAQKSRAIVKAKPMRSARGSQSVLVALGNDEDRLSITRALGSEGYTVFEASRAREALKLLKAADLDLVICDVIFPDRKGIDVLKVAREAAPHVPVLMVAADGSLEGAVESMREGASDYLTKPVDLRDFFVRVERLLSDSRKKQELISLWQDAERKRPQVLVLQSALMTSLFEKVRRVAPARASVLILGESGTGKEIVARSIHHLSPRRDRPFMAINCSAFPETLLESELFGHERGAFTGAAERRLGKFELAQGGTIFLDEIGEMPHTMQAKLLRVLEQKEFMRLGGDRTITVDVRVLAATHRNIDALVTEGKFREDLLYRLKVITLEVPPLRERRSDIPPMVQAFLREAAEENHKSVREVDPEAMNHLTSYRWPGNVRELRNMIEQMVVLGRGPVIGVDDLPYQVRGVTPLEAPPPSETGLRISPDSTLQDIEKTAIRASLARHAGNRTQTAKSLGIGLRTLQRKIKEYGLI